MLEDKESANTHISFFFLPLPLHNLPLSSLLLFWVVWCSPEERECMFHQNHEVQDAWDWSGHDKEIFMNDFKFPGLEEMRTSVLRKTDDDLAKILWIISE